MRGTVSENEEESSNKNAYGGNENCVRSNTGNSERRIPVDVRQGRGVLCVLEIWPPLLAVRS